MAQVAEALARAIEFVPGRAYLVVLRPPAPRDTAAAHFFSIDETLQYWAFYLDFGPLNLGQLYRFCRLVNGKLADPALRAKKLFLFASPHSHKRANAAYLAAAYAMLYCGRTPEEAWRPFHVGSACAVPRRAPAPGRPDPGRPPVPLQCTRPCRRGTTPAPRCARTR
jgi:hypothetical protein